MRRAAWFTAGALTAAGLIAAAALARWLYANPDRQEFPA